MTKSSHGSAVGKGSRFSRDRRDLVGVVELERDVRRGRFGMFGQQVGESFQCLLEGLEVEPLEMKTPMKSVPRNAV